jgi:hypothetical protein
VDVDGEDIEVGIKRERLGDFEVAFDIESFVLIPSRPSTGLVSLSSSVSNIRLSESKEPVTHNIAQQEEFCQEKLLFALDKHRLTTRVRLTCAQSCVATCAFYFLTRAQEQTSERRNRFADQSVISGRRNAHAGEMECVRFQFIERRSTKPRHSKSSTGLAKFVEIERFGTPKRENLTETSF